MSSSTIYIKDGGNYTAIQTRPVAHEEELQRLFEEHTNLVPSELDERCIAAREFRTPAGDIDHLLVDAQGRLMVIETKLARNTTRREVVAQVIDYASQLYRFGPQELIDEMRRKVGYDFTDEWFSSRSEREEFLRAIESNLQNGRLTMAIVMDQADELLKDVVRFINRSTEFTLILAEISVADAGGKEIVTVQVYGDESAEAKTQTDSSSKRRTRPITPDKFAEMLSDKGLSDEGLAFANAMLWAQDQGADVKDQSSGYAIGVMGLSWFSMNDHIEVWAYSQDMQARHSYLRSITRPWSERVRLREPDSKKKYTKIADIEVQGATEQEFRQLLNFYMQGP